MLKRWLKLALGLYLLWLLMSGRLETKFLIMGAISAAVIASVCLQSLWIPDEEGTRRYQILDVPLGGFIRYGGWLLLEIIKASLDVAKAVIKPKMDIQPQLIEFECHYQNPIATTMLVNSIILTPGTVTLDVIDEHRFVVHALTDSAAKGLLEGTMQRHIAALFGEEGSVYEPAV